MKDKISNELNELLCEFFTIQEKKSSKVLTGEFDKNLHTYFNIRGNEVRVKNGSPFYGQITIDIIKKFIDTDATTVDDDLIARLSAFLLDQTPSFELVKNQIETSDIVRFLSDAFKDKYKFTTKYGAVRVMPIQKAKMSPADVKKIQLNFLDTLKQLSHGTGTSYKFLEPAQAKDYSGQYESAIISNFSIPGFATLEEFVITLALGKGDSIEKEKKQLEKLREELRKAPGGTIKINDSTFGPFTDVQPAEDKHAKADVVFIGPEGNLYISLKDGKTPKDYQQWGGVLKDSSIMNDPRMVEFFKECMRRSDISKGEDQDHPNTFNVKLGQAKWSIIPPTAGSIDETPIEFKAIYGPAAQPPAGAGEPNPTFGENFCQFVIQSSIEGLHVDTDGKLKADGKIMQWPGLPDERYKPIFYARSDNSSAIKLKGKWAEAFKQIISGDKKRKNRKELATELARIGDGQIKIMGVRFLIYPHDKKSSTDVDITQGQDTALKESTLITLSLLNELFTEAKNNSHPSAYKAPQGSERDKQLDQTQADLKSGDPQRIQRAYRRRERMEKQARSQPGWKNRPRQDTQSESHEPSQESGLFEAMQTLLEALSKKLKATLRKKALKRGLTPGSVESEYKKGLAAYASSGSRPGMTAHQWAMARVNAATPSKKWATVKKSKGKKKK